MYVSEHLFLFLFLPFYFLLRLKNNFSFIFMTIQRGRAQTFLMNIICSRIFRPVCLVPYDCWRQQHRNTSCLKKIVIVKNKFCFSVLYHYYSTFTYTRLLWKIVYFFIFKRMPEMVVRIGCQKVVSHYMSTEHLSLAVAAHKAQGDRGGSCLWINTIFIEDPVHPFLYSFFFWMQNYPTHVGRSRHRSCALSKKKLIVILCADFWGSKGWCIYLSDNLLKVVWKCYRFCCAAT